MMRTSSLSLAISAILILTMVPAAEADPFAPTVEDYVSTPSFTNYLLKNFSGPTIYPGNAGNLNFLLYNPYSRNMDNITLTAEIYAYATLQEYRSVSEKFSAHPVFVQGSGLEYNVHISAPLYPHHQVPFNLTARTYDNTPEGVYYVRFSLEFDYSNSTNNTERHFVMKSMSFFSKEQWEYATRNPNATDMPYYRHGINVTYLGVDAIIPFTSFSVRRGVSLWPLFVLSGLAVTFAVLAYMYYMNDNYGKYPRLAEKTKQIAGKYEKFRRGLYERARKR